MMANLTFTETEYKICPHCKSINVYNAFDYIWSCEKGHWFMVRIKGKLQRELNKKIIDKNKEL